MGYEVTRFEGDVDEELICTICGQVLEEPVQIRQCEHCFCTECLQEWLRHQQICPVDRSVVSPATDLIQAPRILRNMLSRMKICCENREFGCVVVVRLDSLRTHLDECQYNPKRPVPCEKGCGMIVPLDEVPQHNCVRELRRLDEIKSQKIHDLTVKVQDLTLRVSQMEHHMTEQGRDITLLKDMIRSVHVGNVPTGYSDEVERAMQTARWLASLKPARVRRWGGMISTPDTVLQSIIRRALQDSGCPPYLIDELMANAHERHWPPGLSTLETRQLNRRRYEQYVTKRVPSKQAIIIMSSENEHMEESMIVTPGMVMIFAHGIE